MLDNGEVLVAGGLSTNNYGGGNPALASAELYDPSTGTWSFTANLTDALALHTATFLDTGKVLVAGGVAFGGGGTNSYPLAIAELYG